MSCRRPVPLVFSTNRAPVWLRSGDRAGAGLGPHEDEPGAVGREVAGDVTRAEIASWRVWVDGEPPEASAVGGADGVDARSATGRPQSGSPGIAAGDQALQPMSMSCGSWGMSRTAKPDPSALTVADRTDASDRKTVTSSLSSSGDQTGPS
jgi:hypothetical protein